MAIINFKPVTIDSPERDELIGEFMAMYQMIFGFEYLGDTAYLTDEQLQKDIEKMQVL